MPRGTFDTPGFDIGSDVGVSATVGPMSTLPGMRCVDVKGAHKQVATIGDRNAIPGDSLTRTDPLQMRQEGMRCWVQDRGDGQPAEYQLVGGVDNTDWIETPTATSASPPATRASDDTGTIEIGSILCQSPTTALRVQRANPAANNALSRPVGISTVQQTTQGDQVSLQTKQGETIPVRLVAGLTLALGEEVVLSTVIGEGTIPGSGVSEPTTGQEIQRVGIIVSFLTYGGADRLALCQVDFANRRTAS